MLKKRLVMNHALASSWKDGNVVVDEDNPKGSWPLILSGSYSDIVRGLILETEKWGALPITAAAYTGGDKTRTYNSYDFATVSDRIGDVIDLENGPEVRFDPVLSSSWAISFQQVASADGGEIIDHKWRWNALVPGSRVVLGDEDWDGSDVCGQCFAHGGKEQDSLLVARASSSKLTNAGWPLLQAANTMHATVSELATLRSYARADVANGDGPQRTVSLSVGIENDVRVGDWADVRYGDSDGDVMALKVTDVSGSSKSGMLTVSARERA